MRYAEAIWEIAYKHESYLATEMVLDELLEILRLDYFDHFNASHMAVFMFLYLGKEYSIIIRMEISYQAVKINHQLTISFLPA